MTSPCLHYDCTNRNDFGYCKTTACINPKYNRSPIESTDNTFPTVVIKRQTNADLVRAMTDEKLAGFIYDRSCAYCPMDDCDGRVEIGRDACYKRWLDWLKQEVEE